MRTRDRQRYERTMESILSEVRLALTLTSEDLWSAWWWDDGGIIVRIGIRRRRQRRTRNCTYLPWAPPSPSLWRRVQHQPMGRQFMATLIDTVRKVRSE